MIKIGNKEFVWGSKTYIMGVLNVTPDSFSGDGLAGKVEDALELALTMEKDGADIIDVGGESTRPSGAVYGKGADPVSAEEELKRVLPVIQGLAGRLHIPLSIDTYKAKVALRAVQEGVSLINDVWGLKKDAELARVAAELHVPLVLVHNQIGYEYSNLIEEIMLGLTQSKETALQAGVPKEHIIVDPGIGFGKTAEHNLHALRHIQELRERTQCPILVGSSRKSFIGNVLGDLPPKERLEGTAATIALAIAQKADMVRVHDVKEMALVARMSDAIVRGDHDTQKM